MHIGIEVKKRDVIILSVKNENGKCFPLDYLKISLKSESVSECIDFRKNFEMFVQEKNVNKISLISCSKESSKIRIIIEFIIQEIAVMQKIKIDTYASNAISRTKKMFEKNYGYSFGDFYHHYNLPALTENAFLVAWRFF